MSVTELHAPRENDLEAWVDRVVTHHQVSINVDKMSPDQVKRLRSEMRKRLRLRGLRSMTRLVNDGDLLIVLDPDYEPTEADMRHAANVASKMLGDVLPRESTT